MKIMIGSNESGWEDIVVELHDDESLLGSSYTDIRRFLKDGGDMFSVMEAVKQELIRQVMSN